MAVLLVGAICGCNEIDESERILEYTPPIAGEKYVVLEEFTGQMCPNCPEGAKEAKRIQESYNHQVIIVSIHAGSFSAGSSYVTEAGLAIWKEFYPDGNEEGYPAAMVNRKSQGGRVVSAGYQKEWSEWVASNFTIPPYISLKLEATYDEVTRNIVVTSKVKSTTSVENTKLQILLTEDKIIGMQLGPGGGAKYEHNHMLRGVIGDQDETPNYWGENISIVPSEETSYVSQAYTLKEKWVPENINVVGIVYDANTKEILQAAEIKLIDNNK